MHLGSYAREIRKHLPQEIFRPVCTRLVWMVVYFAIVAANTVAVSMWSLPIWADLGLALVIGFCFSSLGFLGHEILHGAVVRKPWLRDLLGAICMSPFCLSPRLWRKWHNADHHGHTQDQQADPDVIATLEHYQKRKALRPLFRLPPWMQGLALFASFTFWFSRQSAVKLWQYSVKDGPGERAIMLGQALAPLAFWVALVVAVGPMNFLFVYLIPLLIANTTAMSYISTNHMLNPLTPINDPLANSLTVVVPRVLAFLHLNFGYHTEHHIFPTMSALHAPKVMKICQALWPDRYKALPLWKALWMLFRTPRLYKDEITLIDPERNVEYGVLGHGLSPDRIAPRGTR